MHDIFYYVLINYLCVKITFSEECHYFKHF